MNSRKTVQRCLPSASRAGGGSGVLPEKQRKEKEP